MIFSKKRMFSDLVFWGCLLVFSLLLLKDPFSQRNLIPNFEPIPDAFHYVIPARNLVRGDGFNLSREGRAIKSQVGPLYSIILIPFYLINQDPRNFYFANLSLAVLGFLIFYKILNKITKDPWLIVIPLSLYVTNYYLYWFPTLAMAENFMIILLLGAIYLILLPVKPIYLVVATIIALSFYLTKYASAPLTALYIFIYSAKTLIAKKEKKYFVAYIISVGLLMGSAAIYLYSFKNMNIFTTFFFYVRGVLLFESKVGSVFSIGYLSSNLPQYMNALLGNSTKVLWDTTPLIPQYVGILGLVGLIIGSVKTSTRFLSLSLIALLISLVLFMSTFYSFDGRYILHAVPILILGFTIFLIYTFQLISNQGLGKIFYFLVVLFGVWYLMTNGLRLKNQIMLNIKHAETPWYYVSVLEMNRYFTTERIQNLKKPVVISAMAPFFIDLFSNNNYTLLPLSSEQEFRDAKAIVWGPNDYSDLPKLYTKYIEEGYQVYVAKYGLGNESYTNRDYKVIENSFKLTKVQEGCYQQCNIYRVDLKDAQ